MSTPHPAWADAVDAALTEFGLLERRRNAELVSLSENATWLVHLEGEEKAVLRLHRPGYRSLGEIRSELTWIDALHESAVVHTAPVRRTTRGEPIAVFENTDGQVQYAVLFGFVSGLNPDPSDPDAMRRTFRELGSLTARLHDHARHWMLPTGFERMVWGIDNTIGPESAWDPWRANPEIDDDTSAVLAAVEQRIMECIAGYEARGREPILVHGDLRTTNLLIENDRTVIIDFDDAGFAWPLWDLACALSFIESDPSVPVLAQAWVDGYTRHDVLDSHDLDVLPALVMLRRLLLVGWMVSRTQTDEYRRMVGVYVPESVRIGRDFLNGAFLTDLRLPTHD